jgi:hypothetical protein
MKAATYSQLLRDSSECQPRSQKTTGLQMCSRLAIRTFFAIALALSGCGAYRNFADKSVEAETSAERSGGTSGSNPAGDRGGVNGAASGGIGGGQATATATGGASGGTGGAGSGSPDAETDGPSPGTDGSPSALAAGESCIASNQCASGYCVDGVCCATACTAKCNACAAQHTGLPDGTCGPARAGADPHNECEKSAETSCGDEGSCDGVGACRKYGRETTCAPESCAAGMYTPPGLCDGQGKCATNTTVSCGVFPCEGSRCRMTCSSDQQCAAGNYCQGDSCLPKKANGDACTEGRECRTGSCVDGICCNSSCAGPCMSCRNSDTGKPDGQCNPVRAGGRSGNDCPEASPRSCGNTGFCDGNGGCQKHGTNVTCAEAECSDGAEIAAGRCDGKGRCVPGSRKPCNGLKCSAGKCLTCTAGQVGGNCERSTDYCSGGNSCRAQRQLGQSCSTPGEAGACTTGVCAANRTCCSGPCEAKYECSSSGKCGWPTGRQCDFYTDCQSEQCDYLSQCSAGGLCNNDQDQGAPCTGASGMGTCGPRPTKGFCR